MGENINVCKIINGRFSWRLEVDDESIPFLHSADYFEKLFTKLGYIVERSTDHEYYNS